MDHAVNRAPISHEMSTDGRGAILPAERGNINRIGPGEDGSGPNDANAFDLPDSYETDAGGDPANRRG